MDGVPAEHKYQRPAGRLRGQSDPLCAICGWPRRSDAHLQNGDVEAEDEFMAEPWPSPEEVARQQAEFDARARWFGYGPQDDDA